MTTTTAILKYLNDSSNYNLDQNQNIETPVRAKKRRLDHLSWEEKQQRKKLKNRVAAQTSRDRKKAKVDQMEKALQELFLKNEQLITDCDELKRINERLTIENEELNNRLSVPCPSCSSNRSSGSCSGRSRTVECMAQNSNGSTERTGHAFGSVSDPTTPQTTTAKDNGITEDCVGLPSLPDLLDEFNNDVDITSLEQLTQSLLQDIARDLEAASEKADCEESIARDHNVSETVVGSSSKELESSGSGLLSDNDQQADPLIKDISEYLLLHHNYSAKPTDEPKKVQKTTRYRTVKPKSKLKPKQILPKIDTNSDKLASRSTTITQLEDQQQNILYGTFDEDSNCITIIIDDETNSNTTSITNEVIVDTNPDYLNIPLDNKIGSLSPANSLSSGYESHGSPASFDDNDNIWDDRVSELFPSLM